MALPTNKIKKIQTTDETVYDIVPEMLGKNGYSAELPTLTADSTIALTSDLSNTNMLSYDISEFTMIAENDYSLVITQTDFDKIADLTTDCVITITNEAGNMASIFARTDYSETSSVEGPILFKQYSIDLTNHTLTVISGGISATKVNNQCTLELTMSVDTDAIPTSYIASASVNGNTLTLTPSSGSAVTFTPSESHVGDVVSVTATSGSHIAIGGTSANPTVGVESGYSIPSTTDQTSWNGKYTKPSTGIPNSDLANGSTYIRASGDVIDYHSYYAKFFSGEFSFLSTPQLDVNVDLNNAYVNPAIQFNLSDDNGSENLNFTFIYESFVTDEESELHLNFDLDDYVNLETDTLTLATKEWAQDNFVNGVKTLKTDNTTAQSTSSSESIEGSGTINLHKVAKTGTYSDLIGTPTIPTATSDLTNDSGFVTSSDLATVATSGDYDDLINTPSEVTESTVSGWGFTKNAGTVTSVNNTSPDANGNVTLTIPDLSNYFNAASNIAENHIAIGDTGTRKLKDSGLQLVTSTSSGNTTYRFTTGDLTGGDIIGLSASGLMLHAAASTGIGVYANSLWPVGVCDLGTSSYKFTDLYLRGGLRDGNNANYKLTLPDTTSWTANKTIATTSDIPDNILTYSSTGSYSVAGTTKTTYTYAQTAIYAPNGLIMGGTAAAAGLVTRGICGVTTPSTGGACSKDNLYINYDSDNTYRSGRQLILQAGQAGTHYGSNLYQYAAARGDAVKGWVESVIGDQVTYTLSGTTLTITAK